MGKENVQLEVGARSETGYVREENQDRMTGATIELGTLFIVADGMGGHKGGATAAKVVVDGLQRILAKAPADAPVEEVLSSAFRRVNAIVYKKGHSGNPAVEGMGSTAVLLLVAGGSARVAHVGDSRGYLYRDGALLQLTRDHSRVQRMVEAGILDQKDAAGHPDASVLERVVGSSAEVEVDISSEIPLDDGDAFLLCSDGLSGYVTDVEMERVLRSAATVQEIPDLLVALALHKGGHDNVTVQFVQYGKRRETASGVGSGAVRGAGSDASRLTALLKVGVAATILLSIVAGTVYAWRVSREGAAKSYHPRTAETRRSRPPVLERGKEARPAGGDPSASGAQTHGR